MMSAARAVALLAAVLFLANLWGYDLWAPDEPFFAEGAREILVDGQWLVTHVNGVINTHKPPLFFWLIALVSSPFGTILPFVARLVPVAAAMGTLALTMRICARDASARTAALAGAVLCTTYLFWEKARWLQTDSLLCMLIWVALYCFSAYRDGRMGGRAAGLWFWGAAGLAVLDKGPVGLLLPVGIAVTTLAFDRRLSAWRGFAPLLGPLLCVAVVAAWAWPATALVDGYSALDAVKEHFVMRGIHGMHHVQPWYYFATVLPPYALPWTGLLAGAFVLAFRRRSQTDRWLLVTFFFVVVFFSISTEKRELYALPAMPAMAMLVARFAGRVLGWDDDGPRLHVNWLTIGQGVTAAILILLGIALPVIAQRHEQVGTAVAVAVGLPWIVGGLATFYAIATGRRLVTLLAPMAGHAATLVLVVTLIYPLLNATNSIKPFAHIVREQTAAVRAAGQPVLAFDIGNLTDQIALHGNGVYTKVAGDLTDVAGFLSGPQPAYAVIHGDRVEALQAQVQGPIRVIARAQAALQPLALVTNAASASR